MRRDSRTLSSKSKCPSLTSWCLCFVMAAPSRRPGGIGRAAKVGQMRCVKRPVKMRKGGENKVATKVSIIPPTVRQDSRYDAPRAAKRRVAAYARVSTDSEEQMTSYEAQVDYYTKYIKERADWEFVKVYTDEGISATSTKKRDGFRQMVADALDGQIDLIVTKSVSRFARNTVDSLVTVRQLKEKGVEIYFEKENIYTLDSKGELLITIMSSLAQEESRSISENVTWGQRKRMADGKVSMPYRRFLGYEKGKDGEPKIVESEAKTVRLIFRLFMEGKTTSAIAGCLRRNFIARWQREMAGCHGAKHSEQRKIQGRCLAAENIYCGLPHKDNKDKRRRAAPVLCPEQPSRHN